MLTTGRQRSEDGQHQVGRTRWFAQYVLEGPLHWLDRPHAHVLHQIAFFPQPFANANAWLDIDNQDPSPVLYALLVPQTLSPLRSIPRRVPHVPLVVWRI